MLDTFKIFEELSESMGEVAAKSLTKTLASIYGELNNSVKKVEFNELTSIVQELAEAQKRTETRVEELAEAQKRTEARVEELAEAQKRTETRVEELAEAQKRTEARVEELAEAQKRTETRVEELAEAQKRTEKRVEELAEAQKRTEESLNKLIKRVDNIEVQLGGLSMAVGYGIEDSLFPFLDRFVEKVFTAVPTFTVLRKNIVYADGRYDEINLYTEATLGEKQIIVIGECKAQPGKKDIDRFKKMVSRLKDIFKKDIHPFFVGYSFSPDVEKHIKNNYPELKFYRTYEIEHGRY